MAQDVIAVTVPVTPPFSPGEGVAKVINRVEQVVRSNRVLFSDTAAINLIEFRGGEIVTGVQVDITAAFDASGTSAAATATISVPGSTGAVVVWDADSVDLQVLTSDRTHPSTNPGWVKVPDSGGFLILNLTPNTTTVGSLEVYLSYFPKANSLLGG